MQLRASCNACNESKVRCSQQKPTCTRCDRNGIGCIYGLSRRTHKDAPPISFPPSQRGARLSRPERPPRLSSNGHTLTNTNSSSNTATQFNDGTRSVEPTEANNNNANLLADYMFPMPTETDSRHHAEQLLDFSSLVTDSTSSSTMAPGHFPTREAEFANPTSWALGSLFGVSPNRDATESRASWALNAEGECTCHTGVTKLLASMRYHGSNDQRLSPDAQLAKLKQCIVSSETSMECAHGHEDSEPIHIMAVAMLLGYVIDNFKMLASEFTSRSSSSLSSLSSSVAEAEIATLGSAERRSKSISSGVTTPRSTDMSLVGLMEPRLSWGVLELEEDDEMDLRQRLYLLSFRKLERLLSLLTTHLRDLHNACPDLPDASRHAAFVIACDYMRLWLEKKADDAKKVFSVSVRDERIGTAHV